jgi:hypothetical protein
VAIWLYLDQNFLSGMVKRKPAFTALEPVLRAAVQFGAVVVPESRAHALESSPRPDLALLPLLRELSDGRRLPEPGRREREVRGRLARVLAVEYPQRRPHASDAVDLDILSVALPHCALVTCDAHMASVCRRARLDALHGCELFSGRRADVERLTARLEALSRPPAGERGTRPAPTQGR